MNFFSLDMLIHQNKSLIFTTPNNDNDFQVSEKSLHLHLNYETDNPNYFSSMKHFKSITHNSFEEFIYAQILGQRSAIYFPQIHLENTPP